MFDGCNFATCTEHKRKYFLHELRAILLLIDIFTIPFLGIVLFCFIKAKRTFPYKGGVLFVFIRQ
ncbi:hypothetical protein A0049_03775 [Campylobacter upsaliensis]|nr:hypothetical protein [Campylobacter upsaliensis]